MLMLLPAFCALGHAASKPATRPPLCPEPHYADIAQRVAEVLPEEHLSHDRLDDGIANRAWTNYLASLDYDRVYFLKEDIDRFRQQAALLDDRLEAGNIQFAYDVYEQLKVRVRDRCDFVDRVLAQGFDLGKDETYRWKRKDAPWVRDRAEWNELWRKRVKNEYVARHISKEMDEEEGTVEAPPDIAPDEDAGLEPAEAISQGYRRFLTILEDNDAEFVLEKYLSSFALAYDPHSSYMSPSTVADFGIEMGLSLVGIGALLRPEDGAAKIVRLIPGGPADRDKRDIRLRPGDRIVAVAQGDAPPVSILHLPLTKAVKLIRGEKGTTVVLTVIPASDPTGAKRRKVSLVRDEVKLEEQAAKADVLKIDDEDGVSRTVGVIDLPAFYVDLDAESEYAADFRSSTRDVDRLLRQLKRKKVEGIILDLRNNGGGSLPESVSMTGLFIEEGPVVQVKERFGITRLRDEEPYIAYNGPLVVLVNRLSASASEILAGALQDYGRAIVVGDSKTHGKGTVQSVTKLGSDLRFGSLKVTGWIFYRVTGGSTQLKGITPDIVIPSAFDYMEFGEDHLPHALPWSQVRQTRFDATGHTDNAIPRLRRLSENRREKGTQFAAYTQLLKRIEEMNERKELPLDLTSRRALAASEKELTELQEDLLDETSFDSEDEERKNDPVLDETARILLDHIDALKALPAPGAVQPPAKARPAPDGKARAALLLRNAWSLFPFCVAVIIVTVPVWVFRRRNTP